MWQLHTIFFLNWVLCYSQLTEVGKEGWREQRRWHQNKDWVRKTETDVHMVRKAGGRKAGMGGFLGRLVERLPERPRVDIGLEKVEHFSSFLKKESNKFKLSCPHLGIMFLSYFQNFQNWFLKEAIMFSKIWKTLQLWRRMYWLLLWESCRCFTFTS